MGFAFTALLRWCSWQEGSAAASTCRALAACLPLGLAGCRQVRRHLTLPLLSMCMQAGAQAPHPASALQVAGGCGCPGACCVPPSRALETGTAAWRVCAGGLRGSAGGVPGWAREALSQKRARQGCGWALNGARGGVTGWGTAAGTGAEGRAGTLQQA